MPSEATFAEMEFLQGAQLAHHYDNVRWTTESLVQPLTAEDCVVQSMPDASPAKWHLAHTTWFFETFLLVPHLTRYEVFNPQFGYLFNSYYNAIGERHPRPQRGLLTRPSIAEVMDYRASVDHSMGMLLESDLPVEITRLVEIGLHHEQQHQELLLTDAKHLLSCNPLRPTYLGTAAAASGGAASDARYVAFDAGVKAFGYSGDHFCYDNEQPRHRHYINAFQIADRLVTNGEWKEFIAHGGYERPEHWLSDGWDCVRANRWSAPLYWEEADGEWATFTLGGMRKVDDSEPVCHVSFYEADAFARWSGKRLPTEFEWELASGECSVVGNLLESGRLHPSTAGPADDACTPESAASGSRSIKQLFGDVWEWTASPYVAYPGYKAPEGALGEYNGKFMSNQMVLRGGSCVTSQSHIRSTYRNFFPPSARWQFMGLRLAEDV